MHENTFLTWIRQQTPPDPNVPIPIGDDMAQITLNSAPSAGAGGGQHSALLKTDQCLDGIHIDTAHHSPAQIGAKAVNRCLSDCAAMACLPTAIMIAVTLPREGPAATEEFARELFLTCRDAAAQFNCPLVGGDTAIWGHAEGKLAITVSALGQLPNGQPAVTRAGAKPGDTLFVSGALGGAFHKHAPALGRHLSFTPRIHLAQQLVRAAGTGLHAMMDLSDGLAQDLPRLCAASHVGAKIYPANLPIHEDAWTLAQHDHVPPGLHALADGEDYELLFAIDPESVPAIVNLSDIPLTAIGIITAEHRLKLIDENDHEHPWPNVGWEHYS